MTSSEVKDIAQRLRQLGLRLPKPWVLPSGVRTSAVFARRHRNRLLLSGHLPLDANGNVTGPFGKVGADVTVLAATKAAAQCLLSMLASIRHEHGTLDDLQWLSVRGYVNAAPHFRDFAAVLNGCSDLIVDLYGDDAGAHSRIALGVEGLPFDCCVEIEAELHVS